MATSARGVLRHWKLTGALAGLCLALVAIGLLTSPSAAGADAPFTPPPIRHVWIINIENVSYAGSFDSPSLDPYLAQVLPSQGALLRQYFGIGHESLDNYIAQISGQSPTPQTQEDCSPNSDFTDSGTDANGQVIGQGCVYPTRVITLAQQMEARGLTWKGYMEDMGNDSRKDNGVECGHLAIGAGDSGPNPFDGYAAKHNPFVYFHRIIDDVPYCRAHDVRLEEMARDIERVSTTPNLSYITPNTFNDQHDAEIELSDRWLRQYVRLITASPAYRQDGMVIVTFDEAGLFGANPLDDNACCNEIPGPNTPMPGILGPGGGRVGAAIVSPFIRPGTVTDTPYNHYSLLRSLEDLYGIQTGYDDGHGHLGYAGTYTTYPGPGAFGPDVYSANRTGPVGAAAGSAGTPRAADGSVEWANPGPQGNDLHAVSCPSETSCLAVGDSGAVVTTGDGENWIARDPATGEDLRGVSCPGVSTCVAVGTGGKIVASADGGRTWTSRSSGTGQALNGISCSSGSDCVAVGDAGTIVASADGGQTWSSSSSGTQERLNGISCPSATRCFAVGEESTILRSAGGGSNWSTQTAPQSPRRYRAVSCTSQSDCLVIGDYQNWVQTSNGGTTWQLGGGADQIHASGVSCSGASRCLVVGDGGPIPNTFPAHHDRSPGIFAGTDVHGGFTKLPDVYALHKRDSQRFDALTATTCPSTTGCFAVGLHGEIVAFSGLPASSSDPPPTWSQQRPGPVRDLTGASCPQETRCFVVGDTAPECIRICDAGDPARTEATIVATGDGLHWTRQDPGIRERLNAVSCASAAGCVAVGDLGNVVRTDDGSSWRSVADPSNVRGVATLLGVSCPAGTSLCVAVGDHGSAFTSVDGGQTWSSSSSGTEEFLNAVSCASTSACVAVGSSGTVIRSVDGGQTWSGSSSGTVDPLLGVSCPTAQRCVAVGADATVLVSSDQGQSWSSQTTPAAGADLLAVSCASASACSASGGEGTVLATSNGGASWTRRGTGTGRTLAALSCATATSCYEAGDLGAILRPPVPRCQGERATVVGTSAGEVLNGTSGADVIVGLGGSDTIYGLGGKDVICGGDGDDYLNGGSGADVLSGEAGIDTATYGSRTASVTVSIDGVANDGNSSDGPSGIRDNVLTDVENLVGSNAADTLTGSGADNILDGRNGADVLSGLGGIDTATYELRTAGVTVTLDDSANDGNSSDGNADNVKSDVETLIGGTGADTLTGDAANNKLDGGAGPDLLSGLGGADTATYYRRTSGVTVSLDGVANDGNSSDGPAGARDNVLIDVERIAGGSGADTLTGNGARNKLDGGPGADSLIALGGNDELYANDGVADALIDCDGGTEDIAHVDGHDPATSGCETVGS